MINPFKQVDWKPGTGALRQFARSLIIGFPILALLFLLVGRLNQGAWNLEFALKLGAAGAGAGLVFWLIPALSRPFYLVWYALACVIGLVIGNLLLGVFYYTLFTAIALLRRTLGRSPIRKTLDRSAATYWTPAKPVADPASYFNQF